MRGKYRWLNIVQCSCNACATQQESCAAIQVSRGAIALLLPKTLNLMSSSDAALEFKPIDLAKHHQVCVQFRADAFVCSFGSAERFYEPNGAGAVQYLRWLERRIAESPDGCVHLWKTGQIIGQIELVRWKRDASVGYVNLFYLAPEYRGQGLGARLDEYAT